MKKIIAELMKGDGATKLDATYKRGWQAALKEVSARFAKSELVAAAREAAECLAASQPPRGGWTDTVLKRLRTALPAQAKMEGGGA